MASGRNSKSEAARQEAAGQLIELIHSLRTSNSISRLGKINVAYDDNLLADSNALDLVDELCSANHIGYREEVNLDPDKILNLCHWTFLTVEAIVEAWDRIERKRLGAFNRSLKKQLTAGDVIAACTGAESLIDASRKLGFKGAEKDLRRNLESVMKRFGIKDNCVAVLAPAGQERIKRHPRNRPPKPFQSFSDDY